MSITFCPTYNLIFTNDIKNEIITRIKDIQECSDWATADLGVSASELDLSSIDYDDLVQEIDLWANLAKLSVDLERDYDYYRQFEFKCHYDSKEYKERLADLGFECHDGTWKSARKPKELIAQFYVFFYYLCQLMLNEMDSQKVVCCFCDFDIPYRKNNCLVCGSSIEEINLHKAQIDGQVTEGNTNEYSWDEFQQESDNESIEDESREVDYEEDNSSADNYWYEEGDDDSNEDAFCRDQWTCGKCLKMHPYSDIICGDCDSSRVDRGKWRCDKCTLINNCKDEECTVCGEVNELLLVKYCVKCKMSVVTDGGQYCDGGNERSNTKYESNKWRCQYPMCKEYNDNVKEYCPVCRLHRNYFRSRGENVTMLYNDKEYLMWICCKCFKRNKDCELICRDCGESRFEKRYCQDCQEYNNGTTNNCDKCYRRL